MLLTEGVILYQVLSGTFPVAQVRNPMSVIWFLASHINIVRALSLKFPEEYKEDLDIPGQIKWTPYITAEGKSVFTLL